MHLLQRVAHVGVGVGEGGLDPGRRFAFILRNPNLKGMFRGFLVIRGGFSPDCLLVVHERLVELALLLQDGRQVGVRSRKLGKHLQGLQVQPAGNNEI